MFKKENDPPFREVGGPTDIKKAVHNEQPFFITQFSFRIFSP
jgi:hypothetical protein